ncbi:MAG: hypothetical protein ABIO04_05555 [Ferruginibacter sp.]
MNKRILYFFCYACIIANVSCKTGTGLPDLRESYGGNDTKPFGGFVAKNILQNSFPGNYVQTTKLPFAKNSLLKNETASVYFCASRNLFVNDQDVEAIMNYVFAGNTAFLSSAYFDSILLNKLFCKVTPGVILPRYFTYPLGETYSKLINVISNEKDSFGYFYLPFLSSFSEINDRYGRIVGYNADNKPNCIVFWWGKGKLFLHTDPRAFSNYFLLTRNNYLYMQQLMQVTHALPDHVYWDDYYNKLNRRNRRAESSTLSELFKHPHLKAAFWLLLLMLLIYIMFAAKRRQRIIREIKPNQNSSVAFTETIARLYLQKHDNKSIADKMITYFHEFIRNNYYLNTTADNKDLVLSLSRKSGVSEERTAQLFTTIKSVSENNYIDDIQLLSLSGQIQQFYNKKK